MSRIIDLTMKIYEGMPLHPAHGRSPIMLSGTRTHEAWKKFGVVNPYDPNDLVSFQNEQICLCGHTGTHMDACFHGDPDSPYTIDQMPVERGIGEAIWLDVSHRFAPKGEITAKDLKEAEEKSGARIQPGDIVLVHTGWYTMEHDPATWAFEHMGLSRDAGEWLREKQVKTVGLDTCNADSVAGKDMPVHMNFLRPRSIGLGQDEFIAIIENLKGIDKIPRARFKFYGVPLPIEGATGSPIRALAIVE